MYLKVNLFNRKTFLNILFRMQHREKRIFTKGRSMGNREERMKRSHVHLTEVPGMERDKNAKKY